jgi:hypothetical protein
VLYLLLLIGAVLLFPINRDANIFQSKRQAWTEDGQLTFESHFVAWDSEHYLHISEKGYEAGSGVCAFYPLWPMAVRCFSPLVGGNHVVGGMVLANLVSLASFFLFFRLVKRRLGESVAWLALAPRLAIPGSLFFHFNYTEGLFFMLLMLLCIGLEDGHIGLIIIAGFLLPLTRAVGVFCIAPIFLYVTIHNDHARSFLMRLTTKFKWDLKAFQWFLQEQPGVVGLGERNVYPRSVVTYWLVLAPIFGWILYLILMWWWTGNPFEGFAAQKFWGVQSVGNLFNVSKFVIGFLTPTTWHEFNGSFLDRCVFLMCIVTLPRIWRLDKTWFLWAVVLAVVPAVSGTFVSFTRFASVAFPVFIALAAFLIKPERRILRCLIIEAFCILHIVLLWRFVNYSWAG